MTVRPTGRRKAVLSDQFRAALVLALARSPVQRLNRDHVLQRPLALIVLVEPDIRTPRMTRNDDSTHPRDFIDQRLRVEVYVGKIESRSHVVIHAEYQHVPV